MLPTRYVCSSCQASFDFKFKEALYYVGIEPVGNQVAYDDLLLVNVRPAWCKDCDCLCVAEDIASLPIYEGAYAAARGGRKVEYPADTEHMDAAEAIKELGDKLRWRMARRHPARVLCCGGSRYQLMDVESPLLKHAECDFGVVEPRSFIGGYCGPGPGVYSPANIPLYDGEGVLIGQLTWRHKTEPIWDIEPLTYPAPAADE